MILAIPDPLAYASLGFMAGAAAAVPLVNPTARHWFVGRSRSWFASATAPGVFSWVDLSKAIAEGALVGGGVLGTLRDSAPAIWPQYGGALSFMLTVYLTFRARYCTGPTDARPPNTRPPGPTSPTLS